MEKNQMESSPGINKFQTNQNGPKTTSGAKLSLNNNAFIIPINQTKFDQQGQEMQTEA